MATKFPLCTSNPNHSNWRVLPADSLASFVAHQYHCHSRTISVTRLQDGFFNIWPFTTIALKIYQSRLEISPSTNYTVLNNLPKIIVIFCQSSKNCQIWSHRAPCTDTTDDDYDHLFLHPSHDDRPPSPSSTCLNVWMHRPVASAAEFKKKFELIYCSDIWMFLSF